MIPKELLTIATHTETLRQIGERARLAIKQLNSHEATTGASALKQIAYMAEDALRHAENGGSGR